MLSQVCGLEAVNFVVSNTDGQLKEPVQTFNGLHPLLNCSRIFNKLKTKDYKSLVNSKNSRKFTFLVLTI